MIVSNHRLMAVVFQASRVGGARKGGRANVDNKGRWDKADFCHAGWPKGTVYVRLQGYGIDGVIRGGDFEGKDFGKCKTSTFAWAIQHLG
jgi:hypothetical protein